MDILVDTAQGSLNSPPVRHHAFEQRMAPATDLAILLESSRLRFDERRVDIAEDVADQAVFAGVHLGDGLDGFDPTGRVGGHVDGVLMIFVDTRDGLAQRALQGRIARQVLLHAARDAIELALDDSFLGFAARCEQDLARALLEALIGAPERLSDEIEHVVQCLAHRHDDFVRGRAREIHDGDCEHDPHERGQHGVGRDRQKGGGVHVETSFCFAAAAPRLKEDGRWG